VNNSASAKKPVAKKVPKTAASEAAAIRIAVKETSTEVSPETTPATTEAWEVKALKTIDDPNFTYSDADPDAPRWDAAFASLQAKGFMTITQNPANPNDSLFVMTPQGREALSNA